MSRKSIDVVRQVLGAWERGDFSSRADLLDPGIRFETFMPDASDYVSASGIAELEAFTRDWLAQWRGYRIITDELRAVGEDKVFAALRQAGTGHHGGVEVEAPGFAVWTVRNGKVVKLSLHYDRPKALEAAGLLE
jgi:ketosteroid isomerase-like protein